MPADTNAVRNSRQGEVAGSVAIRVVNAKLGAWRSLEPPAQGCRQPAYRQRPPWRWCAASGGGWHGTLSGAAG